MQWFKLYFLMNLFNITYNTGKHFKPDFIGLFEGRWDFLV